MTQQNQLELSKNLGSRKILKISARRSQNQQARISQGDIFKNIEILESCEVNGSEIAIQKITFPFVVCLNQECDLERDFDSSNYVDLPEDQRLIHLIIAPAYNFDHFLKGEHWGGIFKSTNSQKRSDTKVRMIMDNEVPRYHYLKFAEKKEPELIVDFKHFFTINRDYLYKNIGLRFCSLDDLFKECISQRFSNYLARIGLPIHEIKDA